MSLSRRLRVNIKERQEYLNMLSSTATGERLANPTPVVLVAGDFSSAGTFACNAWERICLDYTEGDGSQRLPCPESNHALCDTANTLRRRNASRDSYNGSKLYPVPFSDMGDAYQHGIATSMLRYLCSLNVVSIIACGTARNTRNLLNRLWPLLTPVMIVLARKIRERA